MSFEGAIRELNRLKRTGVMRDFALIGAVAATIYIEPLFTEDADALVLVDSDAEYLEVLRHVGEAAQAMRGMHYIFDGVPVQLLPNDDDASLPGRTGWGEDHQDREHAHQGRDARAPGGDVPSGLPAQGPSKNPTPIGRLGRCYTGRSDREVRRWPGHACRKTPLATPKRRLTPKSDGTARRPA